VDVIKKYLDKNISPAWKLSPLGVRNDVIRGKAFEREGE
jgi:hypothetical protein